MRWVCKILSSTAKRENPLSHCSQREKCSKNAIRPTNPADNISICSCWLVVKMHLENALSLVPDLTLTLPCVESRSHLECHPQFFFIFSLFSHWNAWDFTGFIYLSHESLHSTFIATLISLSRADFPHQFLFIMGFRYVRHSLLLFQVLFTPPLLPCLLLSCLSYCLQCFTLSQLCLLHTLPFPPLAFCCCYHPPEESGLGLFSQGQRTYNFIIFSIAGGWN